MTARRARDPEARRDDIVAAAQAVIIEVGSEAATHRLIAERAGVPLGSTTYYFPTRADILDAAIERTVAAIVVEFERWAELLDASDDYPEAVADLMDTYLFGPAGLQPEMEAYMVAGRDPALQPVAVEWLDRWDALMANYFGSDGAALVSPFLDGLMLQAAIRGKAPSREVVRAGVARLLEAGRAGT